MIAEDDYLAYEDDNCIASYNLWGEGGNIGFKFYNKTDENIYLNMEESFFILNGVSYDYYKERVFTFSKGAGASTTTGASAYVSETGVNYDYLLQTNQTSASSATGLMLSLEHSVSYNEEKIVCIPPKTSKVITEYNINKSLIRDCNLYKYPKSNYNNSISYTKATSPLVFSNRISYLVGQSETHNKFENEFYVKKIANIPEDDFLESKYEEFCGEKGGYGYLRDYFKVVSPYMFYIHYRQTDSWKH